MDTQSFFNPQDPDEDSCKRFMEAAFQVRYPLIIRRYKVFTYERKGNQTYTDFYAKLQELAVAEPRDKWLSHFFVITGLNVPNSDKILSILAQDFTLEDVNRVAVACETAKNYSSFQSRNVSNKVFDKEDSIQKPLSPKDKLKALKQQGKCVRCGKPAHFKGKTCPHRNTVCHKCGIKGHISQVCA